MALITIPGVIIASLFVIRVNKWKFKDLGLTSKIQNKKVMGYAILITILVNVVSLMIVRPSPPLPQLHFYYW